MGLFFTNFQKERPLGAQPHSGWNWTLSVNGIPSSEVNWKRIARALDGLEPNEGSFVILEQRRGQDYWFIQSAIALEGPRAGDYAVGVGWNDQGGRHYLERCGGAGKAVDLFRCVWQGRPLDFSGFEDQSDLLPGNS